MKVDEAGLVQSVRARLLATAIVTASDPNTVLARYGIERYLYRLSISPYADRFVLKGAMLLSAWLGQRARPTRDIDLLGLGTFALDELAALTTEFAADSARQAQWRAFLKRPRLDNSTATLENAATEAARFLEPVLSAVRRRSPFAFFWKARGPWLE